MKIFNLYLTRVLISLKLFGLEIDFNSELRKSEKRVIKMSNKGNYFYLNQFIYNYNNKTK